MTTYSKSIHYGKMIQEYAKEHKISVSKMAKIMGVTPSYPTKIYENEAPSTDVVTKFLVHFKLNADEFFGSGHPYNEVHEAQAIYQTRDKMIEQITEAMKTNSEAMKINSEAMKNSTESMKSLTSLLQEKEDENKLLREEINRLKANNN